MENISFEDMEIVKNIPDNDDLFEITNDFIVAGMSGNGGFNYAQLQLLGVKTPPKTGWKETIIGKKIPREVAKKYLAMKGKNKSVARKEKIKAIQEDLFSNYSDSIELSESDKNIIICCVEETYKRDLEAGNENRAEISKSILDKLLKIKSKQTENGSYSKSLFL